MVQIDFSSSGQRGSMAEFWHSLAENGSRVLRLQRLPRRQENRHSPVEPPPEGDISFISADLRRKIPNY